jgi:hypothetical protein
MNTTSHACLPAVAPFSSIRGPAPSLADRLLFGGVALLVSSFVVVVALEIWGLTL